MKLASQIDYEQTVKRINQLIDELDSLNLSCYTAGNHFIYTLIKTSWLNNTRPVINKKTIYSMDEIIVILENIKSSIKQNE